MLYIAACLLYSLLVSNSIRTHHYTSVRTLREIKHQIDVRRLEKKKINKFTFTFFGGFSRLYKDDGVDYGCWARGQTL